MIFKKKKLRITILVIILLICIFYLFRYNLLRFAGNCLVYEDSPAKVKIMFVLGGGAFDRGNEAVKIFNKHGCIEKIFCTSEMIPQNLKSLGIVLHESELTARNILRQGVPDSVVIPVNKCTSTMEESEWILEYCKENQIKKCIILSGKFHTCRVKKVFKKKFNKAGIQTIIQGAPSSEYNEACWWQEETGLIMVNNEYVKHVYYFLKH